MTQIQDAEILIVGAGPAGLALAQMLRAKDISYMVFERDAAIDARAQGWAVALHKALEPLATMLPQDLGDIYSCSVNAGTGKPDSGVVLNTKTGSKLGQLGGVPKGQPGSMLRVKREQLRAFLSKDVHIEFGKQFDSYREDNEGVTVSFKDGSQAHGSMLVAADGGSSHARLQLLGRHADIAPYIPIVGTCQFDQDDLQQFQNTATAIILALPMISGYYAVCYRASDPDKEAEWAISASKEELFEKATKLTAHLDSSLVGIIHKSGPEAIQTPPLLLRQFYSADTLPLGRVVLIGDALHTMMPFRGSGANTALLDACDLASLIASTLQRTQHGDVISLLQRFCQVACPRGRDVVTKSQAAGNDVRLMLSIEEQPENRQIVVGLK